jgi:hypothetical protein
VNNKEFNKDGKDGILFDNKENIPPGEKQSWKQNDRQKK